MATTTTFVSGAAGLGQLSVSTDGGSVYTAVASLKDFTFPDTTTESYDTTTTDITDGFRSFIGGWSEKGEGSLILQLTQAGYVQLKALSKTALLDWKFEYTDAAQTTTDPAFDFQAHIAAGPTALVPTEDAWTTTLGLKGSGDDTFTEGTTV